MGHFCCIYSTALCTPTFQKRCWLALALRSVRLTLAYMFGGFGSIVPRIRTEPPYLMEVLRSDAIRSAVRGANRMPLRK